MIQVAALIKGLVVTTYAIYLVDDVSSRKSDPAYLCVRGGGCPCAEDSSISGDRGEYYELLKWSENRADEVRGAVCITF
jgi:hypothetical protein